MSTSHNKPDVRANQDLLKTLETAKKEKRLTTEALNQLAQVFPLENLYIMLQMFRDFPEKIKTMVQLFGENPELLIAIIEVWEVIPGPQQNYILKGIAQDKEQPSGVEHDEPASLAATGLEKLTAEQVDAILDKWDEMPPSLREQQMVYFRLEPAQLLKKHLEGKVKVPKSNLTNEMAEVKKLLSPEDEEKGEETTGEVDPKDLN